MGKWITNNSFWCWNITLSGLHISRITTAINSNYGFDIGSNLFQKITQKSDQYSTTNAILHLIMGP